MSEDQDVQDFYDCRMIKRGVNRRVVIASWEIGLLLPRPCKGQGTPPKGSRRLSWCAAITAYPLAN